MYPIKFENLYFDKVWGGRDLALFRNNLPEGNIGESWDVACHKNGMSIVANGEFKGKKLDELIKEKGTKLIGTEISADWFPLLIKLINAKESLSVQVHPNDSYAKAAEGDMGKTEVWYVVEALEGANLIVGTKEGCTKEQFRKAIETGNLESYMNKISVEKGDVYFVKSGLIHAIGEGVVIAEIQQNSDTTYRVYDYDRGRELHIDKALDVVDLNLRGEKSTGIKIEKEGFHKTFLCLCKDFSLELYDIRSQVEEISDTERFFVFTIVEGKGEISYQHGVEKLQKGDSVFIPASLGQYVLKGEMKVLKSYVPDIEKVEKEILKIIKK
ncbi:type I phosphomannose isomerase catalytic subunit [Clostridium sp. DJ247]|uniref:type I phosphomannose isomerase catalytic subunit n=1 Tax=Clostridium sp. DJ247 TaxID=2726188 RepID=UPI0016241AFC|nr:type I phosphomannose isomerase catalytic subunit [Clostridium sp. DJ247]MBC2580753.1 class I mannose-6-phosphate isomerase [Clostridium sp. DJ247]